ncbi:hypothetical protein [Novosphingobium soli]|uniref:Alginate lyase 2 domain-containing protein n=1 Tax=Novosphingobium soli TaxID=574956 RepID=A0ABV6CWC0_9SPHN
MTLRPFGFALPMSPVATGLAVLVLAAGAVILPSLVHATDARCDPAADDPAMAPYRQSSFQDLLDRMVKLQVDGDSDSNNVPTCLKQAQITEGFYDAQNWKIVEQNMMFAISHGQPRNRVELRSKNFRPATPYELAGLVSLKTDGDTSKIYTIAQVFGGSARKPALRLEYASLRRGMRDHIWAVYRYGIGPGQYQIKVLGRATGAFDAFSIRFDPNSGISATYNGVTAFFGNEFKSMWSRPASRLHYKAGCYLKKPGSCQIRFSRLELRDLSAKAGEPRGDVRQGGEE